MPSRARRAVATVLVNDQLRPNATSNGLTAGQELERLLADCAKEWDDALALIKVGTFRTRYEIAAHFKKGKAWAGKMVGLMIDQGYLSREEVGQLLSRSGPPRQLHATFAPQQPQPNQ